MRAALSFHAAHRSTSPNTMSWVPRSGKAREGSVIRIGQPHTTKDPWYIQGCCMHPHPTGQGRSRTRQAGRTYDGNYVGQHVSLRHLV